MDVNEIASLANDAHAMNKEHGDYSFLKRITDDTNQLQNLALAFGELVIEDNNLQADLLMTTDDRDKLRFLISNAWLEGVATGFKCCEVKRPSN